MSNVDIPFQAFNAGGKLSDRKIIKASYTLEQSIENLREDPDAGQILFVDGFRLFNSGAISSNTSIENKNNRYIGHCVTTNSDVGYHLDDNEFYPHDAAGILYLHGGQNVFLKNGKVKNHESYPYIGGLIRGDFGENISLSNINLNGKTNAVLNFTPGYNGITAPNYRMKNFLTHNIQKLDHSKYAVKFSNHYFSKQRGKECDYRRVYNKLENIQITLEAGEIDRMSNEITTNYIAKNNKDFSNKRHMIKFNKKEKNYDLSGKNLKEIIQ